MRSAHPLQTECSSPLLNLDGAPATILDGFARHVARAPDRVALVDHGRHISYGELDEWSSRLARWIAARVGPCLDAVHEPLVPFALAQGPARIAVLLAILKLGGAYVPIEPTYPAARIRQILADIDARFIITEAALADGVVAAADRGPRLLEVLQVDVEHRHIARQDPRPLTPAIDAGSACYVMYTSGSTGTPKGIVIPHRGVVRLCVDTDYMAVHPDHCFGHLANIAFDAATWEIWGALLNGARVALLAQDTALATAALGQAIREHGVTHVFLTTALFNQHVAAAPAIFAPLEYLLFGGEAASAAAVRRLLAAPARPRHLVHVYGPTENTTYSTAHELSAPILGDAVPIGAAIAGSSCHVAREVDGRLVAAAQGERGELLVGGLGLAREYLHDPAATRAKFVECAFAPGERLYRTGDLVEARPAGDLVFVGRIDNQVKLRGFRIELEEIELALAAHPAIGGAVVAIEAGSADHKRLVATVVPDSVDPTPLPGVHELREFLAQRLPSFMIPAAFLRIAAFPLGGTGKVDRRKLAELPREPLAPASRPRTTATASEARVGEIVARALTVPGDMLDPTRDLFELGVDSLLAARIVAELRGSDGAAIGVHDVFRERTIERLAARLDAVQGEPLVIPAEPADHGLPLSHAQEQIWMHQQLAPEAVFYNEPLDITIPEALDLPAFNQALDLLLERHEGLRVRIELVAGVPTQRIVAHEPRPLAVVDLRDRQPACAETEAQQLAEAQARRPFDLAGEPLLRALLVRLADDRFRLHVTGHHLVLDGVTMFQIFLPELETLYRDLVAGRAPSLPPLALRFRDVVAWTRSPAAAARWAGHEAHWQRRLAGAQSLVLPLDRPRPARRSPAGARRCFALSPELARDLRELAAWRGSTLFITLLAGFKALLFRCTRQRDLMVASVVGTRTIAGLDRVAGNFLNTVLLRTDLAPDGSFLDLMAAVERTCVDALAHSEVPFQRIARYAPAGPGARGVPIQAAFVLEPPVAASAGGWTLGQHAVHTDTSKFDLTFELDERRDVILGRVEYRSELFDADTIAGLIAQFERLLASVVADPHARLTALALQGPEPPRPRELVPRAEPRPAVRGRLAPRTGVERILWSIWRDVLGVGALSITDDFFESGGDSLASLTVVARAGAAGLRLAMRDLLEDRTIERLAARVAATTPGDPAAVIAEASAAPLDRSRRDGEPGAIVRLRGTRTAPSTTPLFLVHPAGGSVFGYRELVRHLEGDRPVYGLECTDGYAGKTLTSMAAGYVEAVRAVQPRGPYILGGWSLGGILAAEMARLLERVGETVALVIHLDARPAHHAGQRRYLAHMQDDGAALLSLLARHLGLMAGAALGIDYAALRELPPDAREAWFFARLAEHGACAEALDAGFVRRFIDDFLDAGRLIESLGQSLPIAAPMLLLRAATGSTHYPGFPALEQPVEVGADATYGWGALSGGGCAVELVAGTHEDLVFGPHARELGERLSSALGGLDGDPSIIHPRAV